MKAGTKSILEEITEEELCQLINSDKSLNEEELCELLSSDNISPKQAIEKSIKPISENELVKNIIEDNTLKKMEKNLFVFASEKAGMEKVDKDKIEKVIEEASKDSEYYKRATEKLESMKYRVAEKLERLEEAKRNAKHYAELEAEVQQLMEGYRLQHDTTRTWMHIDMDMFFAAVEIRDNPSLADKPVAVGGYSMISTANYIARKYGVRSAMPGFIGKKLCPNLVFIPVNYKKYKEVSSQVMSILIEYDPNLESMGLDEANLDVTSYLESNGGNTDENRLKLAKGIQTRIYESVNLTASCGIGANKLLAKISCDMHKPNGVTLVPFDPLGIEQFMAPLSVRKIPGVGKVSEQLLNGLGFNTCEDIVKHATELYIFFNEENFSFYITQSLGISRNQHANEDHGIQKSISISNTFPNISL